jgi:hypothetical protein
LRLWQVAVLMLNTRKDYFFSANPKFDVLASRAVGETM